MERFLVKRPDYELVEHRNRPDFILRDSTGEIGFEMTVLYRDDGPRGSSDRAKESRRNEHLRSIRHEYAAIGGRPVGVRAWLPSRPTANTVQVARLLVEHRPEAVLAKATVTAERDHIYELTGLPDDYQGEPYSHAIGNSVGLVRKDSPRVDVIARIAKKATRLDAYRQVTPRVGLIIVVDHTHVSGFVRWTEPEHSFSGDGFEVVYLLEHPLRVLTLTAIGS